MTGSCSRFDCLVGGGQGQCDCPSCLFFPVSFLIVLITPCSERDFVATVVFVSSKCIRTLSVVDKPLQLPLLLLLHCFLLPSDGLPLGGINFRCSILVAFVGTEEETVAAFAHETDCSNEEGVVLDEGGGSRKRGGGLEG